MSSKAGQKSEASDLSNFFLRHCSQSSADLLDWRRATGFPFNRGHRHTRDAAGSDVIKRGQVAANVERESVHRDPMSHPNTDGCDLAVAHPDAGQPFPGCGGEVALGEQLDEKGFDPPQIPMQILPV